MLTGVVQEVLTGVVKVLTGVVQEVLTGVVKEVLTGVVTGRCTSPSRGVPSEVFRRRLRLHRSAYDASSSPHPRLAAVPGPRSAACTPPSSPPKAIPCPVTRPRGRVCGGSAAGEDPGHPRRPGCHPSTDAASVSAPLPSRPAEGARPRLGVERPCAAQGRRHESLRGDLSVAPALLRLHPHARLDRRGHCRVPLHRREYPGGQPHRGLPRGRGDQRRRRRKTGAGLGGPRQDGQEEPQPRLRHPRLRGGGEGG